MTADRFKVWLILLCLLALALRVGLWSRIFRTQFDEWHRWDQTDMATYVGQAERIAAGDRLARAPYHPFHVWQSAAGTESDWLRWYGPAMFHQAPLYSYVLAGAMRLTPHWVQWVKALQLALGVVSCGLLGLVARRFAGPVAGLCTAALAAMYGPTMLLELQLLRESGAIFGIALLIWLLMRFVDRSTTPRGAASSAATVGATCGVFAMFHELAVLTFLSAVVVVVVATRQAGWRRVATAGAALLGGALLGFAPLLARNVAVGAPALSISSRSMLTFPVANMASAPRDGLVFAPPGPELKRILDAADGSRFAMIREVWRGYAGNRAEFFRRIARRLAALAATVEVPDNISYDFHREHVSLLAALPTFRTLFPLGAAGLIVAIAACARRRPTDTPPRPVGWTLAAVGVPLLAALAVTNAQGRYRLFIVPPLMICGGLMLAWIADALAARALPRIATAAALVVALFVAQSAATAPLAKADRRPADRIELADRLCQSGRDAEAVPFYRAALEISPRHTVARLQLARALAHLKRWDEALREYEALERDQPGLRGVAEAISYLRAKSKQAP